VALTAPAVAQDATVYKVADWERSEVSLSQPPQNEYKNWSGSCGPSSWTTHIHVVADYSSCSGEGDTSVGCEDDPAGPFQKTVSGGKLETWDYVGNTAERVGHLEGLFDGEANVEGHIYDDGRFRGFFAGIIEYVSNTSPTNAPLVSTRVALSSDRSDTSLWAITSPIGGVTFPCEVTNAPTGPAEVDEHVQTLWGETACTNTFTYQFGSSVTVHADPMDGNLHGIWSEGAVDGEMEIVGTVYLCDLPIGDPQCGE